MAAVCTWEIAMNHLMFAWEAWLACALLAEQEQMSTILKHKRILRKDSAGSDDTASGD